MTALAATAPARTRGARPLAAPILRLLPFAGIVTFVALRWAAIVSPTRGGKGAAIAALTIGFAATLLLLRRAPARMRQPAAALAALVTFALALLAAGVPVHDLKPRHWGSVTGGLGDGLSALPGIVTPYSGGDRWTVITILLGASIGLPLGAALTFWPRRGGSGHPLAGLVALVGLAAVPATVLEGGSPMAQGALLFVLAAAYLTADRIAAADLPMAVPVLAALAAAAGVLAPVLDGKHPWLNYEAAAKSLTGKGERFSWTQSYGPLHWPRTSHVVLRIQAPHPDYWKTENLDRFDGTRWTTAGPSDDTGAGVTGADAMAHPEWVQHIKVSVRGMRSRQVVTAGQASVVSGATEHPAPSQVSAGTFVSHPQLRTGDYYDAKVYVPRPSLTQLQNAGWYYPQELASARTVGIPLVGSTSGYVVPVTFPNFGDDLSALPRVSGRLTDATPIVERSPYARTYRLAQGLREQAVTPYSFVQSVQSYLSHGFTYTESPPASQVPLETFLWKSKRGYCQQFAGAMALILRMGGLPARVSVGFAPGRFDKQLGAYAVRDDEAHAWVEVWFPGIGWVTFDPTPAVAPALGQVTTNRSPSAAGGALRGTNFVARLAHDPLSPATGSKTAAKTTSARSGGGGFPWWIGVLIGLGVVAAALAGLATWRHRRGSRGHDAWLTELERALSRAGRPLRPGTTLRQLEERLAGSADAVAYVRGLRAERYGTGSAPPTADQRRALRRELGRGLGPLGALRAWWAVPPGLFS